MWKKWAYGLLVINLILGKTYSLPTKENEDLKVRCKAMPLLVMIIIVPQAIFCAQLIIWDAVMQGSVSSFGKWVARREHYCDTFLPEDVKAQQKNTNNLTVPLPRHVSSSYPFPYWYPCIKMRGQKNRGWNGYKADAIPFQKIHKIRFLGT